MFCGWLRNTFWIRIAWENFMCNHGRILSYAFCPKTMTPTRFSHLLRTYANYVFRKGKLELRKKTIFLGFRPTWCGTHQHAHIHHNNSSQKDQHCYIRKESSASHHGLHRCEQIPHCDIVEVPICEWGITIIVKFIIWSIITNDSDSYICVLSIWWRKRNGTQAICVCGLQVAPSWLWRRDIGIDGRFCSLWILTTKKGWRKSIIDAVLNRLIGELFIGVGQKGYPFCEVIFQTIMMCSIVRCVCVCVCVCVDLVSRGKGPFAERPDYRVLGFPCVLGVGGETLSPGWSEAWDFLLRESARQFFGHGESINGRRSPPKSKGEKQALLSLRLTGIRLWAQICTHLNFELRDCLITFPIFVLSQRLIARNVRELFSFNRGVSHLNEACRIDDVSRGSLSCYEILTNN